jgi:putative copper resistance protein D
MTTECFVLTRAVHFGACLLFFGVFVFDRFVAASIFGGDQTPAAAYWQSRIRHFELVLLPAILISGFFWFVLAAKTMSDLPFNQAVQPAILKAVWSQTGFGTVWQWRLWLWLTATSIATAAWLAKPSSPLRGRLGWIELLFGGLLLGGLAWAGHGQEDSPWHLLADVLHLLVAGFWPTGLLPLFLLLQKFQRSSAVGRVHSIAGLVRRFSFLSLASVALLVLTGWVNTWYLVGSFSNLLRQPYGQFLLVKITLFMIAVAIGAVNLLRLKLRPAAAESSPSTPHISAVQLLFNVQLELAISTVIVIIVAILGILPPAR